MPTRRPSSKLRAGAVTVRLRASSVDKLARYALIERPLPATATTTNCINGGEKFYISKFLLETKFSLQTMKKAYIYCLSVFEQPDRRENINGQLNDKSLFESDSSFSTAPTAKRL
ncbi:hypothetical protein Tsp_00882 [Trichinella spiralis]|uniref:hypothetical protein n=1 Tax=Trichinella spiralis TaxID=6334 RepID=UPI0001EFB4B2|nr:hypothetical protein Tsp_00882 [Trichinella spiralis]